MQELKCFGPACDTGRLGLLGNLKSSQIIEQLVQARRYLAEVGDPTPIQRIVFMGMGRCGGYMIARGARLMK